MSRKTIACVKKARMISDGVSSEYWKWSDRAPMQRNDPST
jgi:hypothetical protein